MITRAIKNLTLIIAAAFLAGACTKQSGKPDNDRKVKIDPLSTDEQLVQAAEQLMSPYTFMLADRVLDMALEKNPLNTKAIFYKKLISPLMALKGFAVRPRPYAAKYGDLKSFNNMFKDFPKSPLKQFLFSGKEDIQTIEDVFLLVDKIRDGFNDLRVYIKNNPDLDFEIYLNPYIFEHEIAGKLSDSCEVIGDENDLNHGFEVKCDYENIGVVRVNSADLATIQQYASLVVLQLGGYTGYSLDGIEPFLKNNPGHLTPQQTYQILDSLPNFGKLRKTHKFNLVKSMGSDLASAIQWMQENQNVLCPPNPHPDPFNQIYQYKPRKGNLFENGICDENPNETRNFLTILKQLLRGPVSIIQQDQNGKPFEITVDYFKITESPIQDLKSIFPSKYNSCGDAVSLRDNTIGGMLPNGDAPRLFRQGCK